MWGRSNLISESKPLLPNLHGLGAGTSNYAELMTLKLLLCFAIEINCKKLQVFGDSMVVIN